MADKSFGVKQLDVLGTGTPTISAPNILNLDCHTVAISTSVTVGENLTVSGIVTATTFSGSGIAGIWTVTNNSASNYVISGPGGLSSANNPDLYLERGQTYQFIMNATGHGFGIQTSSGTWNNSNAYTTGITNAGAATGTITFAVPYSAPARLYYACTSSHSGMVGNLYIQGAASTVDVSNNADNRVITGGSGGSLNGEANLKYADTHLQVGGQSNLGSHNATITLSNRSSSARSAIEIEGNTANCHAALDFRNNGTLVSALNSRGSNRLQFCTGSSGNVKAEVTGDHFKITDGDLIIGTAGHGIDFSVTSDASGKTSETLDDYEEGSFTPTLQMDGGGASLGYDFNIGRYTKVGNNVHVELDILINAVNSNGSGSYLKLNGLPFTSLNGATFGGLHCPYYHSMNNTPIRGALVERNASWAYLYHQFESGTGNIQNATVANSFTTTSRFILVGSYTVP